MFYEFIKLREYELIDSDKMIVYDHRNRKKVRIVISSDEKLDMLFFYNTYEKTDNDIQHIIFICKIATIQMKKLRIYKDILKIELFYENELARLLTGNRFIPKHIRLSKYKQEEIFQKFGKENLPLIMNTDPIVKLHDFEIDSVIMIKRKNGIYYRLVVSE